MLTRSALGTQAAGVFCDACHAATGGNPFLLHQLGLAGFLARDPSALDHLSAAHSCARDRRTRAAIALDLAKYLRH